MSKRTRIRIATILVIAFFILLFAIHIMYAVDTGDLFGLLMFCGAILIILNSRRYIKHRKWYVDIVPSLSPPNEETALSHAWIQLIVGILFIIVVTVFVIFL